MTSAAITKREAVATAIRAGIATVPGAWAVYANPADIVSLPAVVIGPGEPYRERMTFGPGLAKERIRLTAWLFVNRAVGGGALDLFDEAADAVIGALDTATYSCAWSGMDPQGSVTVGEVDALAATIDIEVL